MFARLVCSGATATGTWIAEPVGDALTAPRPVGSGSQAQVAAAEVALRRDTDWEEPPADGFEVDPAEPITREVTVGLWEGEKGRFALVEGHVGAGSVCGGDDTRWYAVFTIQGDGLGKPLAPFRSESFAEAKGLVDVDGDGAPEVVLTAFPARTSVVGSDGTERAAFSVDFCDCPC